MIKNMFDVYSVTETDPRESRVLFPPSKMFWMVFTLDASFIHGGWMASNESYDFPWAFSGNKLEWEKYGVTSVSMIGSNASCLCHRILFLMAILSVNDPPCIGFGCNIQIGLVVHFSLLTVVSPKLDLGYYAITYISRSSWGVNRS